MHSLISKIMALPILVGSFVVAGIAEPGYTLENVSSRSVYLALNMSAADSALDRGIQLFKQNNYEDALTLFQEAVKEKPDDPYTNIWLGMALEANKQPYAAMDVWRKGYGNPKWEPVADYLKAMSWWRMGYTKDALAYFNDALLNNRDGQVVNYKPAKEAIRLLNEGASVPDFSMWPELSNLEELAKSTPSFATAKPVATTETKSPEPADKENLTSKTNTTVKPTTSSTETAVKPGAAPKPGKWMATVSNGYKGDVLTFRVSADGKSITDVEFKGHWRSRSGSTQVLMNLDPPRPYKVMKGNFSAVQQNSNTGMWWEFIGRFSSPTSGEGSYRAAFAGGENDTYKLKWTAKRVGP